MDGFISTGLITALVTLMQEAPSAGGVEMAGGAAAPGSVPTQTAPGGGGSPGGGNFLLPMMLLLGAFLIFTMVTSVRREKKQRKEREAMLGALRKHDRVQTIGGVIGTVVETRDDEVVLRVDEHTKMTFARTAVQQVLGRAGAPAATQSEQLVGTAR